MEKRRFVAEQIKELFRIEKHQLQGVTDCTSLLIAKNVDEFKMRLSASFLSVFERLGREVARCQRELPADFTEDIIVFCQNLETRNIAPRFKERILKRVDDAYDQMENKMAEMAAGIIVGPDENR